MNILSLFDGISCGRVALERAGITVDKYYASEIDKYAMQVAMKNYPDTIQLGDINNYDRWGLPGIDMIIGGSPCQDLSNAKQGGEGLAGSRSALFYKFVACLKKFKPKYFLLENVVPRHKEDLNEITRIMGVEPFLINSALVSAQSRKRYYWTNIPGVTQPADKGILLKDILESGIVNREKSYCLDAHYYKHMGNTDNMITGTHARNHRQIAFESIKIGTIENGGDYDSKQYRVYSPEGKATTVCGQGGDMGAKTGLYAVPAIYQTPHGYNKGGIKYDKTPTLTANGFWQNNNKIVEQAPAYSSKNIYTVINGQIVISGITYPINLPDGDYIIRKLTPIECERLQTLPDNYTAGISDTQRYKAIGNGWTVDVVAHIFSFLKVFYGCK